MVFNATFNKIYGNYERKISWIVNRFGKYRRKLWNDMENMDEMWNDMENMEERQVEMWNDMENMEERQVEMWNDMENMEERQVE